jgi:DNA repair exonuclease SbcCD ATPase subunit
MTFNIKEFEEKLFSSLEFIHKLNREKEELEQERSTSKKLINDLNERERILSVEKKHLEELNRELINEMEERKSKSKEVENRLEEEIKRNKNMVPAKKYQNVLEMNGKLLYLAQLHLREENDKLEDLSSNKNIELLDVEIEKVISAQKKEIEELKLKNTKLTNNFTEIYQSENEKTLEIMRLNREISNLKKGLGN